MDDKVDSFKIESKVDSDVDSKEKKERTKRDAEKRASKENMVQQVTLFYENFAQLLVKFN